MRRRLSAAVLALLVAGALTACTNATSGSGSSAVDFQTGRGAAPKAASGAAATTATADRSVVTRARLQLVADDPIAAAGRIAAVVAAAAGTVADSQQDPTGRATADLTLLIPADRFDAALADIERTGRVRDVDVTATDVTQQVADTGVRIATLRTSITRLQQLLARADSSEALVQLEGALTARQTSLEQLLTQQRVLAGQVADATLTVSIVTPAAAPVKGPADFAAGFAAGLHALAATAAGLLVALGVVAPWLVVLGAAGAVVLLVRRLVRRRTAAV